METLNIMSAPSASHIQFGIFNLVLPDIAFWLAVIIIFAVFIWARIPLAMESDRASREQEQSHEPR